MAKVISWKIFVKIEAFKTKKKRTSKKYFLLKYSLFILFEKCQRNVCLQNQLENVIFRSNIKKYKKMENVMKNNSVECFFDCRFIQQQSKHQQWQFFRAFPFSPNRSPSNNNFPCKRRSVYLLVVKAREWNLNGKLEFSSLENVLRKSRKKLEKSQSHVKWF